jgi:ribosomal protein L18E
MSAQIEKLMSLGRTVINAETVFGAGSVQHKRAVAAWRKQQEKMGIKA